MLLSHAFRAPCLSSELKGVPRGGGGGGQSAVDIYEPDEDLSLIHI